MQRKGVRPLATARPLTPNPSSRASTSPDTTASAAAPGPRQPALVQAAPSAVPLFTPTAAASPAAPVSPSAATAVPAIQRSAAAPPRSGALAPQGSARPVVPLARPSAARPVARPVVQRQASAGATPSATPAAAPAVPVVTATPLQRTSAAPAPAPTAHAPRAATTVGRTAPTAPSPSVQRTAAAPGAAEPESPTQLDELARRLVTPLSRLLRAELRADRERVGRLRDHGR
ncbi:hypothetical protein ACFQ71_16650 [Streptomyces sp. NPDC056534]|uniref:hypothetical protein n=1 Tax=Streptomyces sp. NPDC056534 TaxID=3345857 RepID=UPI0036BEC2B2